MSLVEKPEPQFQRPAHLPEEREPPHHGRAVTLEEPSTLSKVR